MPLWWHYSWNSAELNVVALSDNNNNNNIYLKSNIQNSSIEDCMRVSEMSEVFF